MSHKVIIRNSAMCLYCGDEIESTHRHDYKGCTCADQSAEILKSIPESEQYTKKGKYRKSFIKIVKELHGIFVDGGKDYLRHGWYNESDYQNTSIWR